ncbi:hypothetical protein LguiA_019859 [Lonicera macranthoides]
MSALPRSEISFRRSGSSGLVWDDKYLSGELKQVKTGGNEEREREPQSYRTVEIKPTIDPPSPKVSGCGLCGMFGKPVNSNKTQKRKQPNNHNRK